MATEKNPVKYMLILEGSFGVEPLELKTQFWIKHDQQSAIKWATQKMKLYHPVFFHGTLVRVNARGVLPTQVARFGSKVEVSVDVVVDKLVKVPDTGQVEF